MSIFKPTTTSHLNQPMFLGESVDVARYDSLRFPWIDKLTEKQLSFFWRPEEVDLSKDRIDFRKLSPAEQFMFISNLKYQTLLDSVQGRAPTEAFGGIASLPELETWIETWAFSECLAEGTEVLTTSGWKDLSQTTIEDECLVYDLSNDAVFFEHPKRVVEYDMDTTLVEYKSKNPKQYHQLVTPNHRMPVIHRDIRNDGTQKRYFKEAILQEYQSHQLAPISGFCVSDQSKRISPLEQLLIAAQADGSVSDRYTGERCGTIPVMFNLTNERKISRLKEICHAGNFLLTELSSDKRDGSSRLKVNIPISQFDGDCKKLNWVSLKSATLEWCRDFLYEISQWDSHRFSDDFDGTFTYTTTVKDNADIVQAIAALCGKSPRIVHMQDIRKDSYRDTYSINVVNRNTKDGQSIQRNIVPYKGKVRCLETSTGAFLIRFNGVVSVTGNTIHSRSYTHIIRNVFDNPSEVLDEITLTPEILERAESVTSHYDDLITYKNYYNLLGEGEHTVNMKSVHISENELRKKICLTLASVNILEGVRFYVSFACSWSFAERALMEGNSKIIKLIARDESLHLSGTQLLLQNLASGADGDEWKNAYNEVLPQIEELFDQAVQQEKEWAEYLFSQGSVIGLNASILGKYVEYIANVRLKAIGMERRYDTVNNPLPWTVSYIQSDNVQLAAQETEITSYLSGAVDSNITDDLSDLSL